jgi:hypothetical protein
MDHLVKTYGECPFYGHKGSDYPASELTDADAQDNIDSTGNGYELVQFRGEWMCQMCVKRIKAEDFDERAVGKRSDEQKFRDQVGFVNEVT